VAKVVDCSAVFEAHLVVAKSTLAILAAVQHQAVVVKQYVILAASLVADQFLNCWDASKRTSELC